tara:strand:+ start:15131 stop:15865 length:735 start_codon:yes stop_codon:yes gene_type:complete
MSLENIDLSLIIPCYNEEEIIEDNINKLQKVLSVTNLKYEIIFVDDYSLDKTNFLINSLITKDKKNCLKIISHDKNMGRGKSVSDGIRFSKGRVVGFIDIDLSTSPVYIPAMVLEIDNGADIATANRIYKLHFNLYFLFRVFLSKGYKYISTFLLSTNFKDTETGYKFFNRKRILQILDDIKNNHWFWDTEVMVIANINRYKIVELDTLFRRKPGQKSTVLIFRDVINYLKELFRFKSRLTKLK